MPGLINIPSPRAIYQPRVSTGGSGAAVKYGYDSVGGTEDNYEATDRVSSMIFTTVNACHIDYMYVYSVSMDDDYNQKMILGIFNDNGSDYPSSRVASTAHFHMASSAAQWSSAIAISADLAASTKYHLCYVCTGNYSNNGHTFYTTTGGVACHKVAQSYADPFPTPITAGGDNNTRRISMYCTGTES